MGEYRVRMATSGQDPQWCDVCDEAKHAVYWLAPAVPVGAAPRDEGARLLCGGCSEGLEEGAVVTEADLEQRRQRRRGSQEP
jgi:hypothetical protein